MRDSPWATWLAMGAAALVAAACGPSPRIVHQGHAYFEHCYAADQSPRATEAEREQCWSAWLAHYTRHQPAHRIDYALRRIEALQLGSDSFEPEVPTDARNTDPLRTDNSLQSYATRGGPVATGCAATCEQLRAECEHQCDEEDASCIETCEGYEHICLGGCY